MSRRDLSVLADELGALLALMPAVNPDLFTSTHLETILTIYEPQKGLWGDERERERRKCVGMESWIFATL